jgi:hypothetical protein
LKEKARTHEQNEEWGEAIRAYQQVLQIAEQGEGDIELPLFNRIGDLFLRDGKEQDAIRYYELAADHYEAAGFYNNAIALCNKVIRQDSQRPEPYQKLSRLNLVQGFFGEAWQWSQEYADRMIRTGRRKAAFAALSEFASQAADSEIRERLADYLLKHDETAEALNQLRDAYRARVHRGPNESLKALGKKILALDPKADLEALAASAPQGVAPSAAGAGGNGGGGGVGFEDDITYIDPMGTVIDSTGAGGGSGDFDDLDLPELMLETVADSAGIEERALETAELDLDLSLVPPAGTQADPDDLSDDELPALVAQEPEEDLSHLPGPGELLDLELAGAGLGLGGFGKDDAAPDSAKQATAELDLAELELAALDLDALDPGMPDLDALNTAGLDTAVVDLAEFEAAKVEAARAEAAKVEAARAEAAKVEAAKVEAAKVEAARAEAAKAEAAKAEAAKVEAAKVEAAKVEAAAAANAPAPRPGDGGPAPASAAKSAPPAPAGDGDYIDFGAMLLGEDPAQSGLSRYLVEAPSPTGDEDRDFMDMLSQFKSKVSEHLGEEDMQARYDLGLAFKEMGLFDEAIAQFQVALQGTEHALKIYEELGDCFILKGDYAVALKILQDALHHSPDGGAELIGIHYQLGRSYEELGSVAEARDAYERVVAFDLEFRDASRRLARL